MESREKRFQTYINKLQDETQLEFENFIGYLATKYNMEIESVEANITNLKSGSEVKIATSFVANIKWDYRQIPYFDHIDDKGYIVLSKDNHEIDIHTLIKIKSNKFDYNEFFIIDYDYIESQFESFLEEVGSAVNILTTLKEFDSAVDDIRDHLNNTRYKFTIETGWRPIINDLGDTIMRYMYTSSNYNSCAVIIHGDRYSMGFNIDDVYNVNYDSLYNKIHREARF